jgi:hypothetical protein
MRGVLIGLAAAMVLIAACGGERLGKEASSAAVRGASAVPGGAPPEPAGQVSTADTARSAAPAVAGGEAAQGAAPTLDRKIVVNVFLDLTLKDVAAGFQRVAAIAAANGGLVADASLRQEGKETRATVTVRVPTERVQTALAQIRELGAVASERTTTRDVTEEYTDVEARLRTLAATEQQLLVLLGQAKSIAEVLQVQDRLTAVRAEIERLQGRQNLLNRLSDLATIQVQLRPEEPAEAGAGDGSPLAALRRGWEASLAVLGVVGGGLLTALAFSWWLAPLLVIGLWLARRALRARAAARPAPPPAAAGTP